MAKIIDIKEQIKRENKVASHWLIHYRERKREHDEFRQEISAGNRQHDENVGGSRSSLPGKPVENIVCKLDEHDTNNTAKWLQTIEDVKSIIGPKKCQLLELRQKCQFYMSPDGGRPGWIAPVQQQFGEVAGWCPAEQTLKNMWSDLITITVRVARVRGCEF